MRGEVEQGDRSISPRRHAYSRRQIFGDRIIEFNLSPQDGICKQGAREGLGDRSDLEYRVGAQRTTPGARIAGNEDAAAAVRLKEADYAPFHAFQCDDPVGNLLQVCIGTEE